MKFPADFAERMKSLLGEEYESFRAAMEEEAPVRAIRLSDKGILNRKKLTEYYVLTEMPYGKDCYYLHDEFDGKHAYHRAGGFYVQDPGAMSAIAAAPIRAGMRVLDLCAAPGGKSTQIASLIGDGGILYANEPVPARARILCGNLERLGVRCAAVLNMMPHDVASLFKRYFDLTVVDAPCSGEGMLRKSEEARIEWSLDNVKMCAERQDGILDAAAETVRGGGMLLYSTCTFSEEENEGSVRRFLKRHPDFSLIPVSPEVRCVTAKGIGDCEACARFYPHLHAGEGQFMALLLREESVGAEQIQFKSAARPLDKNERAATEAFLKDVLKGDHTFHLMMHGSLVTILPKDMAIPSKDCLWAGVPLGQVQKGRLIPHHAFFSAYGRLLKNVLDLSADDDRIAAYLHGETINAAGIANGWVAVCVEGMTLGGGKVVEGVLKNHYPKGLRSPS